MTSMNTIRARWRESLVVTTIVTILCLCLASVSVSAQQSITPLTTENPKANSYGMEGKISAPPPTQGAVITTPSGGQNFTTSPITVSGSCPRGLLVEVLDNGVMVGATYCENGSFSVLVNLFPGQNDLTARVIDDLGQVGPISNMVTVFYNNGQFVAPGAVITLTSAYSRRSADPGSNLIWPLQLSGGTGPYAFSIDWGDGSDPTLMSQATAGIININHVYKNAGIYQITIKVVDANGATGFLQLIAVANGDAQAAIVNADEKPAKIEYRNKVIWLPALIVLFLLIPAFWLGRRHEARAMRKQLERDAAMVRNLDR